MTILKTAKVKNFQSIADITVDFGDFTVLVGPSNSGKSAFLRGIKACVRNSFVPSNVRQGANKSEVSLEFEDGVQVGIERGKSLSTYTMGAGASVFTKSSRSVPDEVVKALRFPLVSSIDPSFSFQFDRPFLLAETGSVAAQVLGSLTNVSMLHNAVREANRRRQEASGVLKVREQDVEKYKTQLESFRDLPNLKRNLFSVQDSFSLIREKQFELEKIQTCVSTLQQTRKSLLDIELEIPVDQTENISQLRELNQELNALILVSSTMTSAVEDIKSYVDEVKRLRSDQDLAKKQYHDTLVKIGTCPVCSSKIVPDWP